MIRRFAVMLFAVLFVCSIVVITARAGPNKQKAFTSNAGVEMVSPLLATVPTMNGYDVIENLSTESRDLSIAQNYKVDTLARWRLSPTRAVSSRPVQARCRSGT